MSETTRSRELFGYLTDVKPGDELFCDGEWTPVAAVRTETRDKGPMKGRDVEYVVVTLAGGDWMEEPLADDMSRVMYRPSA